MNSPTSYRVSIRVGHKPRKDRINLVLAKRVVFQWLGRIIPGPVAIAAEDNQWWHVSLFGHAVVTDCFAVRRAGATPRQEEADAS